MQLNAKAFAVTAGLIWAAGLFLMILLNLIWSGYAVAFLDVVDSIYPGYHRESAIGLIVGPLYAFVDGLIAAWIFAWVYNRFAGPAPTNQAASPVAEEDAK